MQVLATPNQANLQAVVTLLSESVPSLTADNLMLAIESYNLNPQTSVLDNRPPLTRQEVAKVLKVSLPTVDRYLRLGYFETVKYGAHKYSTRRIIASSVEKFLNGERA